MSLSISSPDTGQKGNQGVSENRQNKPGLHNSKTLITLVSFIALSAIVFGVYAFEQKKEATRQANLAQQQKMEALQQEKFALEQQINADTNREQALHQREQTLESERKVLEQRKIAEAEATEAELNKLEAQKQRLLADQQKLDADRQKEIVKVKIREAEQLKTDVEVQSKLAKEKTQESYTLQELTQSHEMSKESVLLFNENKIDSSRSKALQAFMLNERSNGPHQNNDIYRALNLNWTKSIDYKNVAAIHAQPVHCVTGIAGDHIIFTADESGLICRSVLKNGSLEKNASYAVDGKVRALAVSNDHKKLIAITSEGNGVIFNLSPAGISLSNVFKFSGVGKGLSFSNNENFYLLSSEGIGQYKLALKISLQSFIPRKEISTFATGKSGKFYVAAANYIKIYNNWNDLQEDLPATVQKLDA